MSPIGTKPIHLSFDSEHERVSESAADLLDRIEDVLHSSRSIHDKLRFEYAVAQTKLTLAVVSEGVKLAYCRYKG